MSAVTSGDHFALGVVFQAQITSFSYDIPEVKWSVVEVLLLSINLVYL